MVASGGEVSLNQLAATALAGFVGWRTTACDRVDTRTAAARPLWDQGGSGIDEDDERPLKRPRG
jgi:hypothetical protein